MTKKTEHARDSAAVAARIEADNDATGLPRDISLEQAAIGAILATPAVVVNVVDILEPRHFYINVHAEIFTAILTLHSAGKHADPFTLSGLLQHCEGPFEDCKTIKQYLVALGARAGIPKRIREYALELIELDKRRHAKAALEQLVARTQDRKSNPSIEDLLGEASQQLDAIRAIDSDSLPFVRNWATPRPPTEMLVPNIGIPMREVTLLQGVGGAGKTTLGMQLATSVFLGRSWLGIKPSQTGRTLYVSAEEPDDDLAWQGQQITLSHGLTANHLDSDDFGVISLAGQSAVLASCEPRSNIIEPTPLWRRLRQLILKRRPTLVVLDPLNDLFALDLNSPTQARQCVQLLRGPCLETGCALVLMGHPSIAGVSRGDGTSGSPAWANSARSQLYLERIIEKEGKGGPEVEPDPDVRRLSNKKLNKGRRGFEMQIRWLQPGVFEPDTPTLAEKSAAASTAGAQAAEADRLFLELLTIHQSRGVGDQHTAPNFGPSRFAKEPRAQALARPGLIGPRRQRDIKEQLTFAMCRLRDQGRIRLVSRPDGRNRERLVWEIGR